MVSPKLLNWATLNLSWYQIKILTDLCAMLYSIDTGSYPNNPTTVWNYYHTSNSHERMGISEEALQVCAVYKKSHFFTAKSFENL